MLSDEQEVERIHNELHNYHFTKIYSTPEGIASFRSASHDHIVVFPNAGWTQFRRSIVKASGNGIINLRKHMRADRAGQRSAWSIWKYSRF